MIKYDKYGNAYNKSQIEISKLTVALTASGNVATPTSGKKLRVYSCKFSLSGDADSVALRFGAGSNFEAYSSVVQGGLYGFNLHPNYIQGDVDETLYCTTSTTGTVYINVDYVEV